MHDLLHDPLIGVRTSGGGRRLNLPELLAALSAGTIEGYAGLRAYQADPWQVFLVQLAASIQVRQPTETLPTDVTYWRDGLLALADGKETAWELVVEDVTLPAFLQHPWKSWDAEASDYGVKTVRGQRVFDAKATTPDELDVLVTSKNHDVKMARVQAHELEAWTYALMMLQTTSGYLGKGHYGIVRMNGGYASRSIVSWSAFRHPSRRFCAEVTALCNLRKETICLHQYASCGVVLTWLSPWDRTQHQFMLNDLEPWFIEAARPVRLVQSSSGQIVVLVATTKSRQIGPKSLESGDVGDPWTPINVQGKRRSALTLSGDGFTPQRLTDLLFEQGFELTPLQRPQPGEGVGWFLASCLVRGQGKTEGFYRIELPIPPKARLALCNKAQRDTLGHLAQQLLSDANKVQQAINAALAVLCEGGPEKADFDRVDNWLKAMRKALAQRWEARFFPTLWRGADENHETIRDDWQQRLVNLGQDLLDEAAERLPLPANRTWLAITQAERAWRGMLRKSKLPMPSHTRTEPPEAMEETVV